MTQPLFVNFKEDFVSRIRAEAGPNALVTSSMIQGLRWITNPEVAISGIFLNPNDVAYSAFRFLELTLLQRPATPIFLIDAPQLQPLIPAQLSFLGTESFQVLMEPLHLQAPSNLQGVRKRTTPFSEHSGYLAIPLIDFIHSKRYPFNVFVEDEGKQLRLFAEAHSTIDSEYLAHVAEKTPWLFFSEEEVALVRTKLKTTHKNHMDLDALPLSWKTAETLFNAKTLLNEIRKSGHLTDPLVEQTQSLLTHVFHLVSHLGRTPQLDHFLEQAKNCDRNMECAVLSILMCKKLKFEINAIIEILGLASLFQDISLYQSPFGNLADLNPSELSPEAATYYSRHPILSADLLAQSTSIADVTLQVMRQHHERKDRTGFPGRIGGMQLHPMAEILSLINAYLDRSSDESLEKEVYSHYSDRIVAAFKTLHLHTEQHPKQKAA